MRRIGGQVNSMMAVGADGNSIPSGIRSTFCQRVNVVDFKEETSAFERKWARLVAEITVARGLLEDLSDHRR